MHVGQDDAACVEAREKLGPDAIVGVSVQTVEQALVAQADGADYLGVGAVFGTPTTVSYTHLGRRGLRHHPRGHESAHHRVCLLYTSPAGEAPTALVLTTFSGGTRVQASSTMTGAMLARCV